MTAQPHNNPVDPGVAWGSTNLEPAAPAGAAGDEARLESEDRFRLLAEHQLRELLEVAPDPFVILDDGVIVFANHPAGETLGTAPAGSLCGTAWLERVHPLDREVDSQRTSAAFAGGAASPYAAERLLRLDGTPLEVEVATSRLPWAGRPASLVVFRDVSARSASERALRASEERFRRITESITDGFYAVHVQNGCATVVPGPGCEAVTGYLANELGAGPYPLFSLVVPEDREVVTQQAATLLAGGRPGPVEHRIIRKDGALRWIRNTVVPQHDAAGVVVTYDGLVTDITERRALQDQLRQAQKMEAVGQLAGGIAHDFSNLLTAIRGYADLVRGALRPGDPARPDLDQVIVTADRAAELTGQLLAFSRRQVLQPQVLDAAAITVGLAPMLRRLLGEHIDLDVRGARSHGRVKADPGQLEQIVVNLVVNAGDAMPAGGRLAIETADVNLGPDYSSSHPGVTPGRYVMLTVSDTGVGMDAVAQARVFEPFFTTKQPGKGTGMGLATVYGIVRQSRGFIYLYSEPGKGTTFRIYLPRIDEPVAIPTPPAQAVVMAPAHETILLVEDDGAVRGFARRALVTRGYRVLDAANGSEALALAVARADPVHVLVTDIVMPGMNGRELAERLAGTRPSLRVLFVSGFPERHLEDSSLAAPGVAFLPKPYSADALARAVRAALDGAA